MEGYNGCLLEISENDFILGGEDFDINKLPKIEKTPIEYNQLEFVNDYGRCLCTAYGAMGTASDNLGLELTSSQRKELAKLRYNANDFNPKIGGYISEGVNITRNYLKSIGKDVISYRLSTKTQLFWDLLDKGYSINIGINVSNEFSADAQDNGIVENLTFGARKYGHSIRVKANKNRFIDNYVGYKKYNQYEIKDLKNLINQEVIYPWAYILFEGEAKKATLWNGTRANDIITRAELNIILKRLTSSNKDFYNLERPNDKVSLEEAKIMIRRALNKNLEITSLKRGEIISKLAI